MSAAEDGQSPPPVPAWPAWPYDSGHAELARYVVPEALGSDLEIPAALSAAEEEDVERADRLRAERIYEQLRGWEVKYEREPTPREGAQQIRHPWWIFNGQLGNCLDLSLLFAGYCLAKGVGALLAVTDEHAFVVLTPGRTEDPGARAKPFEPTGFDEARVEATGALDPGVREGSGAALETAIAAEGLIAVNAVGVGTEGSDFETATESRAWWDGRDERPDERIWLVDVPYLQGQDGFAELPHPTSHRPSIRPFGFGGEADVKDFAAHREVLDALRGATGVHALIGPSGRGKSTIARRLAEAKRDGAAWFLDASDRRSLVNSLAHAQLREKGRPDRDVPAVERTELSSTARSELRAAAGSWLVVLDNADGDPRTLRDLLVEPEPDQLLLITSTNEEWARVEGCEAHPLPPVPADELGAVDREAGDLFDGRPLVSEALLRLPGQPAKLPPAPEDVAAELRGPAVYWDLLRDSPGFGERELEASALCAYLPANGYPVAAVEAAVPQAGQAVDLLVERGLLTRDVTRRDVRMHRLFGAAIRHQLERDRPGLCEKTVRLATTAAPVRKALDEQGDLVTVTRLDRRLAATDAETPDPDHELGIALHGVAGLLELHGHTRQSGAAYLRAERHLEDDPVRLADCLHSRARTVNQHQTKDREALEQAIRWAEEGREMLLAARRGEAADEAKADRFLAMKGLLMKPLAEFPVPGKTKMDLLRDALEVIEEADRRRQKSTAITAAEKARSHFNLAGIRIPMAKAEPEQAAAHLKKAHEVYKEVGERRRRLYGRSLEHPHIAACEFGLGLVGYYRAVLIPTSRPQRSEWLRNATLHAVEALRQRGILDGAADSEEASKSAALLAKIALARQASPAATPASGEAVVTEAREELIGAGIVLEPSPPLPPGREGLLEAIEAWARSKSLRELIVEWGQSPPAAAGLTELLEWLQEFSVEWDFRRGERNVVEPPQLTQVTEKVIAVTSRTLGLVGGSSLRDGRYDHVLILGGMARGCLSRPLRTAALIADGALETGAITALGAFRDLGEAEQELVREVAGETVANEYEAIDAGTRQAFGLGSPRQPDRGEDSDVLGAAWRVREYEGSGGIPVSVVAAPSGAPGERRATTPETFAWFAAELAELQPGQRLLIVTTDIYVPYQHADALRLLALPYGVEVDAVGVVPGKVDSRLQHAFQPHNYLQETRSAIRSLRRLHAALVEGGEVS
jgi:hypothetical protein